MRYAIVIVALSLILAAIGYIFWQNELKYSLPTPVPKNYAPLARGSRPDLSPELRAEAGKPLFIHFFNPNCPCSKFNIPHVRSLVKRYGDKISFAIVVLSDDKFTVEQIQDRLDMEVPVSFDKGIADACGVYSTPQAVLLDEHHDLYYRGNYNKSRYCTQKNSNYAQQAIDSMLANDTDPVFNQLALKAYGCELPNCRK